jgi:predicted  nucleic acid-binding Zn-ribbon protein
MNCPQIPVSIGELLDKITILQIKDKHTNNEYVKKELQDLTQIAQDLEVYREDYVNQLLTVNSLLWDIEDALRELEKLWKFDDEFISLARQVYITNDKRAEIKRKINEETQSQYKEIKLYADII